MTSETAKKILHMRQPGGPKGAPWLAHMQNVLESIQVIFELELLVHHSQWELTKEC